MKKNIFLTITSLLLVLLLAACGSGSDSSGNTSKDESTDGDATEATQSEELTFEHELGEVTVSVNPEKIVVFDFGILDSLDKLGVEVTGVPQANIPEYLSKYEDSAYENVGSLKEPDFEKIAEINPDLIVISARQMELYDEFTKLGPTLYVGIDTANYMESFTNNMEIIGQIFDKEDEVAAELAAINETIASVKEKAADAGKGLVILANEGNISAYGPGSRFGLIHDVLGIPAVDENIEVSTHGMNITYEYIAEKNPDYLFVIDRGAVVEGEAAAQDAIENEIVQNTNAYKNDRIVYLDPNYWYLSGGGLISVSEMVNAIDEALQ